MKNNVLFTLILMHIGKNCVLINLFMKRECIRNIQVIITRNLL